MNELVQIDISQVVLWGLGGLIVWKLLNRLLDKWLDKTTQIEYVTVAQCAISRTTCAAGHIANYTEIKADISSMKKVMFHIGMKNNVDEEILAELLTKHHGHQRITD